MPKTRTGKDPDRWESNTGPEKKGGRNRLPRYLVDYYSQIYSGSLQGSSVSMLSRACERPVASGRAIRFEIPSRYLEELSGVKLAEGSLYLIRGRIENRFTEGRTAWKFEIYRFVTAHLKLRIYLPREYHGEVIPGAAYKIVIEAIEEKEAPMNPGQIFSRVRHGGKWSRAPSEGPDDRRAKVSISLLASVSNFGRKPSRDERAQVISRGRTLQSGARKVMRARWIDWRVVAAWIDTEGYLYTREGHLRRYRLSIGQSEPEPLEEIQKFLKRQGIKRCFVKWVKDSSSTTGGIYDLKVNALRDLDTIIAKTEPFLMVSTRKSQYRRYRERRLEAPNLVKYSGIALKERNSAKWMDWRVVASWIDAEGNLTTRERGPNNGDRVYCLDISQSDWPPLEAIRLFLEGEGIKARVVKRAHGSYSLQITTVSDIDLVVKETLPYILTDNKRLQYEEYMTRRRRVPKRGPRPKPALF